MNFLTLSRQFQGRLKLNEPLSHHTTFKIGGKVKIWAEPHTLSSLRLLLDFAVKEDLPILIIGGGSNLLVQDSPLEALAINLSGDNFCKIRFDCRGVVAGAGVKLPRLISDSIKTKRSGLDFLVGIPGSLGGAICTNAAALSHNCPKAIGDIVEEVRIMTAQVRLKTLKCKDLKFRYRGSNLSQCIVLEARLRLGRAYVKKIKNSIIENFKRRQNTQDLTIASAGCIFKNPSLEVGRGLSAGFLIDKAGLKGKCIGQAMVSQRHANFIINRGNAKASEVIRLMNLIKAKVEEKFSVCLEPEIKIITNQMVYQQGRKIKFL
ncbi:MAG: UDP-N-acetylmuramate dehydrogenase [Candidatus Omnitrophota bacterium]